MFLVYVYQWGHGWFRCTVMQYIEMFLIFKTSLTVRNKHYLSKTLLDCLSRCLVLKVTGVPVVPGFSTTIMSSLRALRAANWCLTYLFLEKSACSSWSFGWKNWTSPADWLTRGSQLRSALQYFCRNLMRRSDLVGPFFEPLAFILLSKTSTRGHWGQNPDSLKLHTMIRYREGGNYLEIWGGFCLLYFQLGMFSLVVSENK